MVKQLQNILPDFLMVPIESLSDLFESHVCMVAQLLLLLVELALDLY